MTNFFGSCTACTIGKLHNADLHTTSLSPPSTTVGQCIFFDFQLLITPSVGDNTQHTPSSPSTTAPVSCPFSDPIRKIITTS